MTGCEYGSDWRRTYTMCVVRPAWGIKYAAFVTFITYVTVEVNLINATRITDFNTRVSTRVLVCNCKITY